MNKETILKYEKEFLAWCKGESVLKGSQPISVHNKGLLWEEVKDFSDWKSSDTIYVLNDSYSIYRKALAEGKTIEVLNGINEWIDLKTSCLDITEYNINNIRIKPEEPQFKVGDWVKFKIVHKNFIVKYESNTQHIDYITINDRYHLHSGSTINDIEPWKPQPGEWCWFYDYYTENAILDKFHSISNKAGNIRYKTNSYSWVNCEPFIGELPTFLKDK